MAVVGPPSSPAATSAGAASPEARAAEAEARGDWSMAAEQWAAACDFARAGSAALRAGDAGTALSHAARARDAETERAALDALPLPRRAAVAHRLAAAGLHAAAGRAFAAAGLRDDAAHCLEQAGAWLDVVALHEAAGDLPRALAALERARAEEPGSPALAERSAALTARLGLGGAVPAALGARFTVTRALGTTPLARWFEAVDALDGATVTVQVFRHAHGEAEGGAAEGGAVAPNAPSGAGRARAHDAVARFERAVRALAALAHPAVVPLRAYHAEGPTLVLGVAGPTLHERYTAGRPSPARAVEMVGAVLSALGAAHRAGVLHGELSPHCVFVDEAGGVRVADFGLAALRETAATVTVDAEGPVAFLAPEQRAGAAPSVAGDVYGAGALLWWLLGGAVPVGPSSAVPATLSDAQRGVLRALLGAPRDRPATAEAARALLRSAVWSTEDAPTPSRGLGPASAAPPGMASPGARFRAGPAPEPGRGAAPRFVTIDGARHRDTWLDRDVLRLPATDEHLGWARAWAALDPALAALPLGLDAEGWLLVEAPRPLGRALRADEAAALERARAALPAQPSTRPLQVGERAGHAVWCFPC